MCHCFETPMTKGHLFPWRLKSHLVKWWQLLWLIHNLIKLFKATFKVWSCLKYDCCFTSFFVLKAPQRNKYTSICQSLPFFVNRIGVETTTVNGKLLPTHRHYLWGPRTWHGPSGYTIHTASSGCRSHCLHSIWSRSDSSSLDRGSKLVTGRERDNIGVWVRD